ncbi:MAG: hypothetical protein M1331_00810 [Candidatus Marsarchaeota archaeon]|nr:hypothetical protein [Candidatus Marsarchaeota archaeon]MCL5105925.1 hypothetical protein [Candidatus Marsarchaeota archaeon]
MVEKRRIKRERNIEYISAGQSNFINAAEFEKYLGELGIPVKTDDAERAKFVLNEILSTKAREYIQRAKKIADEGDMEFGAGSVAMAAVCPKQEKEVAEA